MAPPAEAAVLTGRRRSVVALGLVIAAWLGGTPARSASRHPGLTAVVRLTIHHSRYSTSLLHVPAGRVRFIVRNTDPIDHELIIGDLATQDRHEKGTDAHHDAVGEISVPAGGVAETTYTFAPSQTTLFGCHLPGHWAYGMRGTITSN